MQWLFTLPDTIISRGRQRQQSTGILQFPSNLGVHGMLMIFKDYSYANQQSGLLESIPQTNIKNSNYASFTSKYHRFI